MGKNYRDKTLLYIESQSPNTSQIALTRGVSILYETVRNLNTGDVVLTAKVHAGKIALIECKTTDRIFPQQYSTNGPHKGSEGVSLEEAASWFLETLKNKEYGHVELTCTVRDGRAVRVYRHSGDQHRVKTEDGAADAA